MSSSSVGAFGLSRRGRPAHGWCPRSSALALPDRRPSAQAAAPRHGRAMMTLAAVRPRAGLHAVGRDGHDRSPCHPSHSERAPTQDSHSLGVGDVLTPRFVGRVGEPRFHEFRLCWVPLPLPRRQRLDRCVSSRCDIFRPATAARSPRHGSSLPSAKATAVRPLPGPCRKARPRDLGQRRGAWREPRAARTWLPPHLC